MDKLQRQVLIFYFVIFLATILTIVALAVPGGYYYVEDMTGYSPTLRLGLWKWCKDSDCQKYDKEQVKELFKLVDGSNYSGFQCSRVSSAMSFTFLFLGLFVGIATFAMNACFNKWIRALSYTSATFLLLSSVLLYIGSFCFTSVFYVGYQDVDGDTFYYSWNFAYYMSFTAASLLLYCGGALINISTYYR